VSITIAPGRRGAPAPIALDQVEPVHLRHVAVHDRERERRAGAPALELRQRRVAAVRERGLQAPAGEHVGEDAPIRGVVIHDQHLESGELQRVRPLGKRGRRAQAEFHGEPEHAAASGPRLHADPAAHQLGQSLRDREPQPRAAILARRRAVGLAERLEDGLGLVGGDADAGVGDGELEPDAAAKLLAGAHADHDLALIGELYGVADQVGEDLAEARGVAEHCVRHVHAHVADQLQVLLLRAQRHGLERGLDAAAQRELDHVQVQAARLDPGEVEDVVDHRQQQVAGGLHQRQVLTLLVVQLGLEQQLGHAEHAVHRRPDLVAHVGHELRLEPRVLERRLARADQLGLRNACGLGEPPQPLLRESEPRVRLAEAGARQRHRHRGDGGADHDGEEDLRRTRGSSTILR
jgi:hypothetical protein